MNEIRSAADTSYENVLERLQHTFAGSAPNTGPVMSFHPKIDLNRPDLEEISVAAKLADLHGQRPIWIPYTYDPVLKTGAGKAGSAVTAQIGGSYHNIVSNKKTGVTPICAVDGYNAAEVKEFVSKMRTQFVQSLASYREQIGAAQPGHPLFHMRGRHNIDMLESVYADASARIETAFHTAIPSGSLSNQLAHFSGQLAKIVLGVDIDIQPIDEILATNDGLVDRILTHYQATEQAVGPTVKMLGDKGRRNTLHTTPDGTFIADNKEMAKEDVAAAFKNKQVTISGNLLFAIMNDLGHKVALGGYVTQPYYGAFFQDAHKITDAWQQPYDLKYMLFNMEMQPDMLSIADTAATLHILHKDAESNLREKGAFKFPDDVVSRLAALGGADAVPQEYAAIATPVLPNTLAEKNRELYAINGDLLKIGKNRATPEEIKNIESRYFSADETPGDADALQKKLRGAVSVARGGISATEHEIRLKQAFLGGTVDGLYRDGVAKRSISCPTALNLILNGQEMVEPEIDFTARHADIYCLGTATTPLAPARGTKEYFSMQALHDDFLAPQNLPFNVVEYALKMEQPS